MSVKKLQNQFIEFIYENKNTDLLSQEIISPYFKDAMAVYRKHVWYSLINTLKIHYSSVLEIIGEDDFLKIAQEYVFHNPSKTPDLELYGFDFPEFLKKHKKIPAYIRDIANLDIAHVKCAIAIDFTTTPTLEFQKIKPQDYENITFISNPTNIICDLKYEVFELFNNLSLKEKIKKHQNTIIVSRNQNHKVQNFKLSDSEKTFLELTNQNERFIDIFEKIEAKDNNFDLQKTLSKLIENNLIIGFLILA